LTPIHTAKQNSCGGMAAVSISGVNDTADRDEIDLSGIESDIDAVQEALDALDDDDLDRAEAIAASLDGSESETSGEDSAHEV